jgi:hypothetical protein
MAELDLGPEDITSIFPDVAEKKFKVTKDEEKKILEEALETKDSKLPPFNPFGPSVYGQKLEEAKEQKIQNKMEYVSEIIGAPVQNVGFSNYKDLFLTYDLSRSNYFKNRQKKFMGYYPKGEYQRVSVDYGDGNTEKLELFKYDKDDNFYKVANPYGRDFGEIGRVAGTVIDEAFGLDVAALGSPELLKKMKHPVLKGAGYALDAIPPTLRVTIANYLGLKGKELTEFMRGFGENEYDVDNFAEVDFFKTFTDLDDYSTALLAGGLYKGTTEFANYLLKGKRPGMVDMGEDIIRASEELNLEPLVFAQLAANPIIRRIYTQSGLFVQRPELIKQTQLKSLQDALKKFGVGTGDGQLDFGQLDLLNKQLSLQIANDSKLVSKGVFTSLDEANVALQESINAWNKVTLKTTDTYTNKAIKAFKDSGEDVSINITQFKNNFSTQMKSFFTKYQPKDKTVGGEYGTPTFLTPPKKTYGSVAEEFKEMDEVVKNLDNTISSLKDGNLDSLKTLIKMRTDLHKLTMHPDEGINAIAGELHENLIKVLKGQNIDLVSGPNSFKGMLNILDNHMAGEEAVRSLGFIKDALTKGGDPDKFVSQFMKAGNTIKVSALKNMLLEGTEGTQKEGAEKAFNVFKNAWITNTLKNKNGVEIIDDFLTKDKESLKVLLGDNYEAVAKQMKEIIYKENKLVDGIVTQATRGNSKEFAEKLIKESQGKGSIGLGNKFDEYINDLGGVDSNAADVVRYHIISGMLQKSQEIVDKAGKKAFSDTLNPRTLRNEIRALQQNEYLMRFFDEKQIKDLQNFNLYTTALAGGNDVGGMIAAGAEVAEFVDKFNVGKLAFSLLKYDIVSRLLSKKATSSLLSDLDATNAISPNNLRILNTALAELEKDVLGAVTDVNEVNDQGILFEFNADDLAGPATGGTTTTRAPIMNVDEAVREIPMASVNPSSRLSGANIATPIIDPNRAALAFGSDDILTRALQEQTPRFAAKGGIMNTKKAFQRVA